MEYPGSKRAKAPSSQAATSNSSLQLGLTSPATLELLAAAAMAVPSAPSLDGATTISTALVDDNTDRMERLSLSARTDKETAAARGTEPEAPRAQYDAVIFHDPADLGSATLFKDRLVKLVGCELLVTMFGCESSSLGRLYYETLEDTIRRSTFMLLFVTKKFCNGPCNAMLRDTCLSEMLSNDEKRWCLIPIWTTPEEEYSRPIALRPLTGISEKNMSDAFRRQSIIKVFTEKRPQRERRQQEQLQLLAEAARDRQRKEEESESERRHKENLRMIEEDHRKQLLSKQRELEVDQLRKKHVLSIRDEVHAANVKQQLALLEQTEQEMRHGADQQVCSRWQLEQQARLAQQRAAEVLHLRGGYATGSAGGSSGTAASAAAGSSSSLTAAAASATGPQPSNAAASQFGPLTSDDGTGRLPQWPLTAATHVATAVRGPSSAATTMTHRLPLYTQLQWQQAQPWEAVPRQPVQAARESPGAHATQPPPPYSSGIVRQPAVDEQAQLSLLATEGYATRQRPLDDPLPSAVTTAADVAATSRCWPHRGADERPSYLVGAATTAATATGFRRSGSYGSLPSASAAQPWPGGTTRQHTGASADVSHMPVLGQPPYMFQMALPRTDAVAEVPRPTAFRVVPSSVGPAARPNWPVQQQQEWDDRPYRKEAAAAAEPPSNGVYVAKASSLSEGKKEWLPRAAADDPAIASKIENVRDRQQAILNDCAMMGRVGPASREPAAKAVAERERDTMQSRTPLPKQEVHGCSTKQIGKGAEADSRQWAGAVSDPADSGSRRGVFSPPTYDAGMQPDDSSTSQGSMGSRTLQQPLVRATAAPAASGPPPQPSATVTVSQDQSAALPGLAPHDPLLAMRLQQQLQTQVWLQQQLLALYGAPPLAWTAPEALRLLHPQLLPPHAAAVSGIPAQFGAHLFQSHSVPGSMNDWLQTAQYSQLIDLYRRLNAAGLPPLADVANSGMAGPSAASLPRTHPSDIYGNSSPIGIDDNQRHETRTDVYPHSNMNIGGGSDRPRDSASLSAAAGPGASGVVQFGPGFLPYTGVPGWPPTHPTFSLLGSTVDYDGRATPMSQQCTDVSSSEVLPPRRDCEQDVRVSACTDAQGPSSAHQPLRANRIDGGRSGYITLGPPGEAAVTASGGRQSSSASEGPSSWSGSSGDRSLDSNTSSSASGAGSSGDSGHGGAFRGPSYDPNGVNQDNIPQTVLGFRVSMPTSQTGHDRLSQMSCSTGSSQYGAVDASRLTDDHDEDADLASMQPLTTNPPSLHSKR